MEKSCLGYVVRGRVYCAGCLAAGHAPPTDAPREVYATDPEAAQACSVCHVSLREKADA